MWEVIAERVAVSVGTLLVVWMWKELAPRVAQRFYREPLIDGPWKTTFSEGGTEFHEHVALVQKGRRVHGEITLQDGEGETKYKMTGVFRHLILTGTYEAVDP